MGAKQKALFRAAELARPKKIPRTEKVEAKRAELYAVSENGDHMLVIRKERFSTRTGDLMQACSPDLIRHGKIRKPAEIEGSLYVVTEVWPAKNGYRAQVAAYRLKSLTSRSEGSAKRLHPFEGAEVEYDGMLFRIEGPRVILRPA